MARDAAQMGGHLSAYYYFSFHFVMRPDATAAVDVLAMVAKGQRPTSEALSRIHPVPRFFLEDSRRFLDDEDEPQIGTPVRLAAATEARGPRLSIELCMHDDLFANGGYMFWLWLLSLVEPAAPGTRQVIGYEGPNRNDAQMGLTLATADGVTPRHGDTIPYEDIQQELADWTAWDSWSA